MKAKTVIALLLATLVACNAFPKTPEGKEYLVVTAYTEALNVLLDLRKAGKISDEDWVDRVIPAVRVAKGARLALKEAREAGIDPDSIEMYLRLAIGAMNAVIDLKNEINKEVPDDA